MTHPPDGPSQPESDPPTSQTPSSSSVPPATGSRQTGSSGGPNTPSNYPPPQSAYPPPRQPAALPKRRGPSRSTWITLLVAISIGFIFLLIGGGILASILGKGSFIFAIQGREVEPGQCVVLSGEKDDPQHTWHDCDESAKHAWIVTRRAAFRKCEQGTRYYETDLELFGVKTRKVTRCLAPLYHEDKCYTEDELGVVPTKCVSGTVKAVKVKWINDASICPSESKAVVYPEIRLTYCLRKVK